MEGARKIADVEIDAIGALQEVPCHIDRQSLQSAIT
jgi:hypothetical protein